MFGVGPTFERGLADTSHPGVWSFLQEMGNKRVIGVRAFI